MKVRHPVLKINKGRDSPVAAFIDYVIAAVSITVMITEDT